MAKTKKPTKGSNAARQGTSPKVSGGSDLRDIPLSLITVADRFRAVDKTARHYQSLVSQIRAVGLLVPITVRPMGKGFALVAGEHRLEVYRDEGKATIPALVRHGMTDADAARAQIAENTQRLDFNWEQLVAIAERMRPAIFEANRKRQLDGKPSEVNGETEKELADLLKTSPPTLKKATDIINAWVTDPCQAKRALVDDLNKKHHGVDGVWKRLQRLLNPDDGEAKPKTDDETKARSAFAKWSREKQESFLSWCQQNIRPADRAA